METDARAHARTPSRARARLLAFAVAILAVAGTGCAPGSHFVPPAVAVDPALDERIRREVAARLGAEASIAAGEVRVEVSGATVALHGSVRGIGAWQCALRNAALVEGVARVADYLMIERGPREVRCLAPRQFDSQRGSPALPERSVGT